MDLTLILPWFPMIIMIIAVAVAVVGSGMEQPDLCALISRALESAATDQAREERSTISTDLNTQTPIPGEIHP